MTKKVLGKGLGKGLSALLSEEGSADRKTREIPLNQIEPNPSQPRKSFEEESLAALAASIKTAWTITADSSSPRRIGTLLYRCRRKALSGSSNGRAQYNCVLDPGM